MKDPQTPAAPRRTPAKVDLPAYALATVTLAGFAGGWHWLLDLASNFRWYWLLATLAWFAVAARRRSRAATACLAVAAVANLWAILPYWMPVGGSDDADGGGAIDLVAVNVLAGNPRKDELLAYLRLRSADIVVLVEVDAAWAATLGELEPLYPHRVVEPRCGNFGIAMLSRLPLEDPRVMPLADGPPVIVAGVAAGHGGCLIVAAHPPAPLSASWAARRDAQLAAIGDLAATSPRPVIVAGDLNASPWSHGFRQVVGPRGLRDSAVGRGLQATWNVRGWLPRIPIDHILVSREVQVRSRGVGPDIGSDHLPVEAGLTVP